ncbi:TrlF family AAA-like ATPase [Burkholderia vietnamiensis]|uniref:TrlF family AAA-like ATPase n=1 Tax=Burkholderia vietnamiensis TaxID=60552 RepID=UPI0007520CF3|nr:AAA family ATPase [Burkholderia vietnamiensis]
MNKSNIKVSNFPNGSQWRRWDLHVHTPASKLGASFVGVSWDDYIDQLEALAQQAEIAVIGVTDYMSIDGYERLHATIHDDKNPRLRSVSLLVPNIELRAMPATRDGKALNIHILVDPSDPDHIQKIKRALRNLKVEYTSAEGRHTYGCIREDLIEYAKAQNPNLTNSERAYKFGIEQFKPSYEQILEWLRNEGWLKNNSLVGIANGKDGISGLPADGFAAVRDQLLKNCDFIFSGNQKDRDYYLGQKAGTSADDIKRMYGSLKPCLHGSDAHEIGTLFRPDEDRYCWIKSDPTFEGLRQILWEPDDRVHIGKAKPQLSDMSRIIEALHIKNSHGWFAQNSINLNPGLVAIIGEKGSGKTAIADLIAFASGVPIDLKSQSSFIAKGRLHLAGVDLKLTWGSGSTSGGTLTDKPYSSSKPLVRYLSQDFVERLCSEDHQGHELREAIEEVVFSHLDEVHREDFSSFEELRMARESASQSRQDDFRGQIVSLHREIDRLYASLGQRAYKVANKEQTLNQIEELKKQLPLVTQAADEATLRKLSAEQDSLKALEASISQKNRSKRNIEEFLKSYSELKDRTARQVQELVESAQFGSLVSKEIILRLNPQWDEKVEDIFRDAFECLDIEVSAMRGNEGAAKDDGGTLYDISRRIYVLQESLSKDEINKKRLLDLQRQINGQESTVQRLVKEIEELDGKTTKLLAQRERDRDSLYLKFFEALAEDEEGLRELYAPMKEQLDNLGSEMKFELSAGYRVETQEWLEKSMRFFDGRKPQASAKKDEIEKFVIDVLSPAWNGGDLEIIKNAMTQFLALVHPVEFMGKYASPSLKFIDLLDWMYSTDHIGTTYKIKYGGTSLEHLSPGTRGIALLVLYLLMDEDDRRPLIIDQPEGNLDNSSIYLQLVPYIRKAKEKRQIILVTHNPNLVVATDAEQIIVALAERSVGHPYPQITYISGSLEHDELDKDTVGIRQAVCTLLEGGDRAFKEREGRYSIR